MNADHKRWFDAARVGDHGPIRDLIGVIPVDIRDAEGYTALAWLVRPFGGNATGVQMLIDAGADVNARSDAYESLVDLCFEGVCSGLERGLAEQNAARMVQAGFKRMATDMPSNELGVAAVERRCVGMTEEEVEAAVSIACARAANLWALRFTASPMTFIDPELGRVPFDPYLLRKAIELPADSTHAAAVVAAMSRQVAAAIRLPPEGLRGRLPFALFAVHNQFQRSFLGRKELPAALILAQAIHGLFHLDSCQQLLNELLFAGLESVEAGRADG